jgi:hypothetical protein
VQNSLQQDAELAATLGLTVARAPVFNNVPQDQSFPYILVLSMSSQSEDDKDSTMERVGLTVSVVTDQAGDRIALLSAKRIKHLLRLRPGVPGLVDLCFVSQNITVGGDGVVRVLTLTYFALMDGVGA